MADVKTKTTTWYELGNPLRGWFGGEFASDDEAWDIMSERFNRAFPSRSGRDIQLRKIVREGQTAGGNETEADRILREKIEKILTEEAIGMETRRAETTGSVPKA